MDWGLFWLVVLSTLVGVSASMVLVFWWFERKFKLDLSLPEELPSKDNNNNKVTAKKKKGKRR